MRGFHIYPNFSMKFLRILHGQLLGVHCLIFYLKTFRFSEFFISFGEFPLREMCTNMEFFLVPVLALNSTELLQLS